MLDFSRAKLIMLLKTAMLEQTTDTDSVSYFWKMLRTFISSAKKKKNFFKVGICN